MRTLVATDDMRIDVKGLDDLARAGRAAAQAADDMRETMRNVGRLVTATTHPPVLTGRLASTVRATTDRNRTTITAGGPVAPYAGIVHDGDTARHIKARPFLTDALTRTTPALLRVIETGVADILRKADLT